MNLNNLKPAWRKFLLLNSMQTFDQNEILSLIEGADHQTRSKLPGVLTSAVTFITLIVCCQGG